VAADGAADGWFSDIVHHHLGLFALGYALGRQLQDWGIKPLAMLGNSVGEYAPATLAGVWTPADAAELVYQRATAMANTAPGRMAAVNAPADEVSARLGPGSRVAVAVVGPSGVVIAGPDADMAEVLNRDVLRGLDVRPLDIRQASHGAAMDPAAEVLATVLASTPSRKPRLRLVANTTGDFADPEAVTGPDYWAQQLRRPVQLDSGMRTLLDAGCTTFIELGPGTSMIGALRRHQSWDTGHATVPMLGRPEDGERGLLRAMGLLWERGADSVLDDLVAEPRTFVTSLPTYPFAAEDPQLADTPKPAPRQPARVTTVDQPVRAVLERLWCAALGVASAADQDDFFALGGESLMVLNLLSQVRERTNLSIPVSEFSQAATFGRLVRLAEARQSAEVRHLVSTVTLRQGGAGQPLILAADSAGSALSYRVLADQLGDDRPVYALEPVDTTTMRMGVRDLAAHHVDAVLRIQPSGPYLLGGWSFGAVLAHEMARQLTERGARVALVACLDAFVQGWRGIPIGFDPGFLSSHVQLQFSAALGTGLVGDQARRNPGLRKLLLAKAKVLAKYRPEPVPTAAVVFSVDSDERRAERLRARLAPLYGDGVTVHPIGGDHWSILAQPHAGELATRLREALRACL
jgi:phthiocerol/phenolphthiocerol synthesis type-I polyketide synthase E